MSISVEHLKVGPPVVKTPRQLKPKVFVATGNDIPLKGTCLLFIKAGDPTTVITDQNMSKVTSDEYGCCVQLFLSVDDHADNISIIPLIKCSACRPERKII